jgi:ligand-binding sensor domain-containing protein/AraC-like DNA-binding protein
MPQKTILLLLSLLGFIKLYAQPMCEVTHFDENNGLAHWHIMKIKQDSNGMLWFATTNGLDRFDGYKFTNYNFRESSTSLSDHIKKMSTLDNGDFVCLNDERLFVFNPMTNQAKDILVELEKQYGKTFKVIHYTLIDGEGLWIECSDGTCIKYKNGKAQLILKGNGSKIKGIGGLKGKFAWILREDGAYLLQRRHLTFFPIKLQNVYICKNRYTWFEGDDGTLARYVNGHLTVTNIKGVKKTNPIKNGDMILMMAQGLYYLNTANGRLSGTPFHGSANSLNEDSKHNMWINDDHHSIWKMDLRKNSLKKLIEINDTADKRFYTYEDNYGMLWIITQKGRLFYTDHNRDICFLYPENKFGEVDILGTDLDKQNNLWLTSRYGVFRFETIQKPAYELPLANRDEIKCTYRDKYNRYWICNYENKTVRIFAADNHLIGYLGPDGKIHQELIAFGASVYCITETKDGAIWLGSKPDGMYRLKSNKGKNVIKHFSTNCDNIYCMKQDARGRLWVATLNGGLTCIPNPSAENPTILNEEHGLKRFPKDNSQRIRDLVLTRNGIMIGATSDGIFIFDTKTADINKISFHRHIHDVTRPTSLSSDATMNLFIDSKQRIFICTENEGLDQIITRNILQTELTFRHFNKNNCLSTNVINSMGEAYGHLWIVSNNMVMMFEPEKQSSTDYDLRFWKSPYRFSPIPPLLLPDNRLLISHTKGAIAINRHQLERNGYTPKIVITDVYIENKSANTAVTTADTITLEKDERNAIIHFAALDYTNPELINYELRLEGKDGTWKNVYNNHTATLLGMSPGTYHLYIRSTNSNGKWADNTRKVTIIVKPKFSETIWAKILYILLGYLFVTIVFQTIVYIRKIKRDQKEITEQYLALLNRKQLVINQGPLEQKHKLQNEDDAFMKRLMVFVEENIAESNISLEDMASATATSRSGLNRKVKSITGLTPGDFLLQARVQKAKYLLNNSDETVRSIAFDCGYNDPKYFSKIFKKTTGKTPMEFKMEQKTDK